MNIENATIDQRETFRTELTEYRSYYKELSSTIRILKDKMRTSGYQPTWQEHHRLERRKHEARYALLAYGFVRGIPYLKMESQCEIGNEPISLYVLSSIKHHFPSHTFSKEEIDQLIKVD